MAQLDLLLKEAEPRSSGSHRWAGRGPLSGSVTRRGVPLLWSCLAATTLFAGFPGSNGEIAFTRLIPFPSSAHCYQEIFTIIPHGPAGPHDERRLTTSLHGHIPGDSLKPAYSPDGSLIAYASNHRLPASRRYLEIGTMAASGQQRMIRTQAYPALASDPAWAPNGVQIAYIAHARGGPELRLMDLFGERTLIVNIDRGRPAWSPDGASILYGRAGQLWKYSLATGQA